jgi:hypothetical protein
MTRNNLRRFIINLLFDVAGSFFFAIGIYNFAANASFAPGGVTGIAFIVRHYTHLPIGTLTLILNIPNSRFVLDRYHLERALHAACNRYKAPSHWRTLQEALKKLDLPKLVETLMTCGREGICSYETARTTIYYLVNNWEGIEITKDPNERPGASCAEGLVGHLLSDRLSRRPLSWSREGVTQMAALRAFISNGGTVSSDMLRTQPKNTNDLPAKKKINLTTYRYCPMPSDALKVTKRGTPLYRLCKAITNGGMGGLIS